jgi:hypothetical protein
VDATRDSKDDKVRKCGSVHDPNHGNREPDQTDW